MIRIQISEQELYARIDGADGLANWRTEATIRTQQNVLRGRYEEPPAPNWSEVKPVFLELQHGKCLYCERKLGTDPETRGEWDLEHFRPKSSVKLWPTKTLLRSPKYRYGVETGSEESRGYYKLAYSLLNYGVSCKSCNSALKRDYFPVLATRDTEGESPMVLASEEPCLVFPLGEWGEDPSSFLRFVGTIPVPVTTDPKTQLRGRITIDFFKLDIRENLREERADVVTKIWAAYVVLQGNPSLQDRKLAQDTLAIAGSPKCRHHACAKTFLELVESDPSAAGQIATEASAFLASKHLL